MSKRQEYWKKQGATDEKIQNHLEWERGNSKRARERKKRNNEKNQELIKQIKIDLLGKTFEYKMITKINETNDGVGFWWHCFHKFPDGSSGNFRYFYRFEDYSLEDFKKDIKYI